jgi:hypothetical protein
MNRRRWDSKVCTHHLSTTHYSNPAAMTIKSSGPDEDDTFAQAGKATKRAVVLVNPKRARTFSSFLRLIF